MLAVYFLYIASEWFQFYACLKGEELRFDRSGTQRRCVCELVGEQCMDEQYVFLSA